jgi:hypothetical protein
MSALKLSGAVTFVGSILFLIAAFSPISRVYALPTAENKLGMITGSPTAWVISQTLFALGAIVTALGIALAAYALRDRPSVLLFFTATAFLAAGAAAWSWHVYLRAAEPAAFVNGSLPGWHFALYTLLTMAALLLIGIALQRMGFPTWAGWLLIGGSILFFVLYLIFKDMPPFVYYLMGATLAFVLFRGG